MGFLHRFVSLSLTVSSLVAAQSCKLQFDGRLPTDLVAADLDATNDFFSNQFVIGKGLTVSQSVRILPAAAGSLVRPHSPPLPIPPKQPPYPPSHANILTSSTSTQSPNPSKSSSLTNQSSTARPPSAGRSSSPPATTAQTRAQPASRPCTSAS